MSMSPRFYAPLPLWEGFTNFTITATCNMFLRRGHTIIGEHALRASCGITRLRGRQPLLTTLLQRPSTNLKITSVCGRATLATASIARFDSSALQREQSPRVTTKSNNRAHVLLWLLRSLCLMRRCHPCPLLRLLLVSHQSLTLAGTQGLARRLGLPGAMERPAFM